MNVLLKTMEKKKSNTQEPKIFTSLKLGLNCYYMPSFYNQQSAKIIYERLEKEVIYNSKEESKIMLYGKQVYVPRQQVAYGEEGTTYTFSGITVPAKKWLPILSYNRKEVEYFTGLKFNFVLVNRYKDGEDHISFHSDKEADLGLTPSIASISFGAERDFLLKHNGDVNAKITIKLESGSLFLMKHPTNANWKHALPKRTKIKTPRINLTFRYIFSS